MTDQQGFDDSEVMSFVNNYGAGGNTATVAPPESQFSVDDDDDDEDQTEQEIVAEAEANGLDVSWVQDGDTITLHIAGAFEGDIRAVERGDKTVFVSSHFGGEQTTLKKALDAVARNTASRAVAAEWERQNPKQDKAPRQRAAGGAAAAKVEALDSRMGNIESMLAQLLGQQDSAPAAKPNPARINRS